MPVIHPIAPLFNSQSHTLILGSFPSVKSRESGFFYGHPQNRFWKVIASIFDAPAAQSIPEKKDLILSHHLALWDVIASCEITGSSDTSISDVTPNDLHKILDYAPIERIFVNGKTAEKYYRKFIEPELAIKAVVLPSTSPANAAWNLEKLLKAWEIIKPM